MKKYHMQKSEKEITDIKLISEILIKGKYATLAFSNNYDPYIVTLSYGYNKDNNCLYFHTAKKGVKLEFIRANSYVCGTVIEDLGYRMNECSHSYRSVVFWGIISIVDNVEEKRNALDTLFTHLEENPEKFREKYLSDGISLPNVCILRLYLQEITGKAS